LAVLGQDQFVISVANTGNLKVGDRFRATAEIPVKNSKGEVVYSQKREAGVLEVADIGGPNRAMTKLIAPAAGANTVVIGFKQTMINDTTDLVGETESVALNARKAAIMKTLTYSGRSSAYREIASITSQLDWALKAFGVLTAGITIYTEARDTCTAFEEMKRVQLSYSEMQNTGVHPRH